MHFKKIICHHKVVERCIPVFNKFFMKKIIARAEKKKKLLIITACSITVRRVETGAYAKLKTV